MIPPKRVVVACLFVLIAAPSWAQTATQPRPDPVLPSFGSLFRELPADFVRLVKPEAAMILAAGGGGSLAVHPADSRLTRNATKASTLEEALDAGQVVGDGYAQMGGAFATFLAGRLTHNARIATVGAELVRAQLVAATLTAGVKVTAQRRRPDGSSLSSFPSGHTSASFATATVLQREFGWKVGSAAYAFASYVAISRLTENKHYASDIAFGAAIGIVAGRCITINHGDHALTISPMAVPRGAGVGVAWTPRR